MSPSLIILLLVAIIGVTAVFLTYKISKRKKAVLLDLRNGWGRERKRAFKLDFDKIAIYHKLKTRERKTNVIDNKTWDDLNLNDVFSFLDRTSSKMGQQYLYYLLKSPQYDEEPLKKFDEAVKLLTDIEIREKLQLRLITLNNEQAFELPNLFLLELPASTFRFFFLSLSLIAIALLAASFFNSAFLLFFIAAAGINLGINLYYRRRVILFITPLQTLGIFLSAAHKIGVIINKSLPDQSRLLKERVRLTSNLLRFSSWFLLDKNQELDFIIKLVFEYLNMFFLMDVVSFAFSLEELRKNQSNVEAIYETLGFIDAAISVASVRAGADYYCSLPQFLSHRKYSNYTNLYHPLISDPVANSFTFNGKGVMVTGSNMSGKTTFMRSIGVNAVLAQTIYTCFAEEYQAPFVAVRTSIGRSDNLLEGKSYFQAEVESILAMLNEGVSSHQHLFLIDELFRGTNAVERIAAAKAILDYLDESQNFVFVSTHDIELVELLNDKYESYHFREIIRDGQMSFDYKLQPGTSSTKNAIELLKLSGYPSIVIKEALQIAQQLERSKINIS